MATISKTTIDFFNIKGTSSQLATLKTTLKATEAAIFTATDTKRLYLAEYNKDAVRLGSNVEDVTLSDAGLLTINYINGTKKEVNLAIDGALDELKTTILNTVSTTYATKGELSSAQTTLQGNIDGKVAKVTGTANNIVFFGANGAIQDKSTKVVTSVGTTGADTSLPTEKAVRSAIASAQTTLQDNIDKKIDVIAEPVDGNLVEATENGHVRASNHYIAESVTNDESIPTAKAVKAELAKKIDKPTSTTANGVVIFSNTTGDVKNSGITIATSSTTLADSDTTIPTSKAVKNAIGALGSVFTFKGVKTTYAQLPTSGNKNGDVWQVTTAGTTSAGIDFVANTEFYWDGSKWDILGVNEVDMSDYITTEQFTAVNDALGNKLDNQAGAATTNNIVTWGNSGGEVSDSGKKFSDTVANDATTIPTGAAVTTALNGKISKVASATADTIPTLNADGTLKNGTFKIVNNTANTEIDSAGEVGTMSVINELFTPRTSGEAGDIVVFDTADGDIKTSTIKIADEVTSASQSVVYTGAVVEALIAEVKTKWYEIK